MAQQKKLQHAIYIEGPNKSGVQVAELNKLLDTGWIIKDVHQNPAGGLLVILRLPG